MINNPNAHYNKLVTVLLSRYLLFFMRNEMGTWRRKSIIEVVELFDSAVEPIIELAKSTTVMNVFIKHQFLYYISDILTRY